MRRRTLIVSDTHLATLAPPGGFPVHRRGEHAPDLALARMLEHELAAAARDRAALDVILAGDTFDLDAPPIDRTADGVTYRTARSSAGAARLLEQVLEAHPRVVEALGRCVRQGARVVAVPGNHDAQLALPGVREVLVSAVGPMTVRSWFDRSGDVLVEHGHQYDPLCRMDRLHALVCDGPGAPNAPGNTATPAAPTFHLEDTVGSIGTHHGQEIFRDANPFALDPLAGVRGRDVARALRACIAQPGRVGCFGALRVLAALRELLAVRRDVPVATDTDAWLAHVARETGAPRGALEQHHALAAAKADAASVASAATGEYAYGDDVERRLRAAAGAIGQAHGARVVVFGHTHVPLRSAQALPHVSLRSAQALRSAPITYVNSGSWAPGAVDTDGGSAAGTYALIEQGATLEPQVELRVVPRSA